MSLTKASYSLISGAPVNVLDYGADNTGIADSADAFNAAFAASTTVYVPRGTYLVNSEINIPSSGTLFGENKTNTVIKAGTYAQNVIELPQSNYNVRIRRISLDCDSLASQGIVSSSTTNGEAAHLLIEDVAVYNSIGKNINLKYMTYAVLRDVYCSNIASNGLAYGLYLENCNNCEIRGGLYYNCKLGSVYLLSSSANEVAGAELYNDATVSSPTLIGIENSYKNTVVNCSFEPQGAANVVTNISVVGTTATSNCTDNIIDNCVFNGLANTATHVIAVGTAGPAYKTLINNCKFIKPTSTSSILLTNQTNTAIINCVDLVSYDTPTYTDASVTNNSGNTYYLKSLINGFNFVNPLINDSGTIGNASLKWNGIYGSNFYVGSSSILITSGANSPEGAVTAPVGSLYTRTNGGANTTLYIKESGTGNTGWVAK